jgi:hypothetical protein
MILAGMVRFDFCVGEVRTHPSNKQAIEGGSRKGARSASEFFALSAPLRDSFQPAAHLVHARKFAVHPIVAAPAFWKFLTST